MARVILLLALIVFNLFNITFANDDISEVIDLYKSAKYQECVTKEEIIAGINEIYFTDEDWDE